MVACINLIMAMQAHSVPLAPCCAHCQEELEALEKRQTHYNTMDKKCSDLMKEVKLFQESLADYNTVLDKVGRGSFTRP